MSLSVRASLVRQVGAERVSKSRSRTPSICRTTALVSAQGRRHVAVGSWYLSPGLLWTAESEAALEAGASAVSAPMGGEPEIIEVALTRYVVAAMELVDPVKRSKLSRM